MSRRDDYGVSTRTLTVLCYVVTGCWAANIVAPMLIAGYSGNTGVNGVMGALLGLLGAFRYRASLTRDSRKEPRKKAEDE